MVRLPSGPPPLPVLGNLLDIGLGKGLGIGEQPHVRMTSLAQKYGDVMALSMGSSEPEPWVVLSSPEAVHEAFVKRGNDFSGRPMVASMAVSSGGGKGFAQPTMTKELRELRRVAFTSLFSSSAVEQAQLNLDAESKALADHLLRLQSSRGAPELRPALRRAVTNMVCTYVFSTRVPFATERATAASDSGAVGGDAESVALTRELAEVVDEIWKSLTATATTAADLLLPAAQPTARAIVNAPLAALVERRNRLLTALVARRVKERELRASRVMAGAGAAAAGAEAAAVGGEAAVAGGAASSADASSADAGSADMLDALLDAGLSEEELLYTLVDLFVAGVNTVATTLEWTLLLTANDQQAQARARAEALRVSLHPSAARGRSDRLAAAGAAGGGSAGGSVGGGVAASTPASSPHILALVSETLRYKPPLLLPRRAVRDSTVSGFHIKAGTLILANNHALTQQGQWWRQPNIFRPARFLEEEAALRLGAPSRAGTAEACKFIPFSVGARVCPGARLAEAQLTSATRVLLSRVRWARDGDTPIDLSEEYSLTLRPAVSQRLRFSPVVVSPRRKRPAAAAGGVTRGVVVPTARGISNKIPPV